MPDAERINTERQLKRLRDHRGLSNQEMDAIADTVESLQAEVEKTQQALTYHDCGAACVGVHDRVESLRALLSEVRWLLERNRKAEAIKVYPGQGRQVVIVKCVVLPGFIRSRSDGRYELP